MSTSCQNFFIPSTVIEKITFHELCCAITSNCGTQTLYVRRDEINNGRVSFVAAEDMEKVQRAIHSPNVRLVLFPDTKQRFDRWFAQF